MFIGGTSAHHLAFEPRDRQSFFSPPRRTPSPDRISFFQEPLRDEGGVIVKRQIAGVQPEPFVGA